MFLLDYICGRRRANGTMPENPVMIKTIVTIDMAERIAAHYGVETKNVLTGFKFIGEQIGLLEQAGQERNISSDLRKAMAISAAPMYGIRTA